MLANLLKMYKYQASFPVIFLLQKKKEKNNKLVKKPYIISQDKPCVFMEGERGFTRLLTMKTRDGVFLLN